MAVVNAFHRLPIAIESYVRIHHYRAQARFLVITNL